MALTVVKILRPAYVDDERARRRLRREADALSELQHPGLTRLLDRDTEGTRPFLEIEHVAGPRLSTLIRRAGPLRTHDAVSLGRHLAATLAFLHARGWLHLDVKPSNVVMGSTPRLIDFSVARRTERAHRINGFVGTDAYMSPEQADPARWRAIGPASDSWGLGVTLHRAVTGRLPFPKGRRDGTGPERFPQLDERPAPLDPIRDSAGLRDLITATLVSEASARPPAEELVDRFDQLAAHTDDGKRRFR